MRAFMFMSFLIALAYVPIDAVAVESDNLRNLINAAQKQVEAGNCAAAVLDHYQSVLVEQNDCADGEEVCALWKKQDLFDTATSGQQALFLENFGFACDRSQNKTHVPATTRRLRTLKIVGSEP